MSNSEQILGRLSKKCLVQVLAVVGRSKARRNVRELAKFLSPFGLRSDVEILNVLDIATLRTICGEMGVERPKGNRESLIDSILESYRSSAGMKPYGEYPSQIDDDPSLLEWATKYCLAAERAGDSVCLGADSGYIDEATATFNLCLDLYEHQGEGALVDYDAGDSKARYSLSFDEPERWNGGNMTIRNPWDFDFSDVYDAGNGNTGGTVSFDVARADGKKFRKDEHLDVGRAIVDGMRYEYDDEEFRVYLSAEPDKLGVRIENAELQDVEGDVPDKDGIVWQAIEPT